MKKIEKIKIFLLINKKKKKFMYLKKIIFRV